MKTFDELLIETQKKFDIGWQPYKELRRNQRTIEDSWQKILNDSRLKNKLIQEVNNGKSFFSEIKEMLVFWKELKEYKNIFETSINEQDLCQQLNRYDEELQQLIELDGTNKNPIRKMRKCASNILTHQKANEYFLPMLPVVVNKLKAIDADYEKNVFRDEHIRNLDSLVHSCFNVLAKINYYGDEEFAKTLLMFYCTYKKKEDHDFGNGGYLFFEYTMYYRSMMFYNKLPYITKPKQSWIASRAYKLKKDSGCTLKEGYAFAKKEYETEFGKPLEW